MKKTIYLNLNPICRAWPKESVTERAEACRAFLLIHGYLSERENEKVAKRIGIIFDENSNVW